MRFKVFALAACLFLAAVSLYQDHVLREQRFNLNWLMLHCRLEFHLDTDKT